MKKLLALALALAIVISAATVFVSAEEDEPEAYLVIKTADGLEPSVTYTIPGDKITGPVTIEALAFFGEDCTANGGCVYLNIYPWDDAGNLLHWTDYAKDSTVELGKWTLITLENWDCSSNGVNPDKATLTAGFWQASGTLKIAYIKASVGGEEIWAVDYADGFDITDASSSAYITEENEGVTWEYVGASVPVEESAPAVDTEPTETEEVNYASGKTYTVEGNVLRNDNYDDVSNNKLTDGIVGIVNSATDLCGFKADDNGVITVVFDLGEVKSFGAVKAYAVHYDSWGIPAPVKVEFAFSEDGATFGDAIDAGEPEVLAGTGAGDGWDFPTYTAEGDFSGRYVKVMFYRAGAGHLWTSEVLVLGEEAVAPVEESQAAPVEESQAAPVEESKGTAHTGDAGIIALAVVSVLALGGAVIVKKCK